MNNLSTSIQVQDNNKFLLYISAPDEFVIARVKSPRNNEKNRTVIIEFIGTNTIKSVINKKIYKRFVKYRGRRFQNNIIKRIVELRDKEDKAFSEITEQLNLSQKIVRSLYHRGINRR